VIYRFRDCELETERLEFRRVGIPQSLGPQVFRSTGFTGSAGAIGKFPAAIRRPRSNNYRGT
jgi:hypothetical protein